MFVSLNNWTVYVFRQQEASLRVRQSSGSSQNSQHLSSNADCSRLESEERNELWASYFRFNIYLWESGICWPSSPKNFDCRIRTIAYILYLRIFLFLLVDLIICLFSSLQKTFVFIIVSNYFVLSVLSDQYGLDFFRFFPPSVAFIQYYANILKWF